MKKMIMAALALLSTTAISAQQDVGTWSIVPRIGVNLSNLSNNSVYVPMVDDMDHEEKSKFKAGMKVGVDLEYQLARYGAVSVGVFYSMQGSRYSDFAAYEGTQAEEPTTKVYTGWSDLVTDRQYVTVPVMGHIYLAKNFALKAGVQLGFLVKAETRLTTQAYSVKADGEYTYETPESTTADEKSTQKKVDFSIPIGLSYEYENVILDARYDFGVTKTNDFGMKNRTFEFTVGYSFAL